MLGAPVPVAAALRAAAGRLAAAGIDSPRVDAELLLAELLARCEARGARQMLAVIGDSANAASIGLHRALGFAPAGLLGACGWKHDRWLDVVVMQRALGSGAGSPPDDDAA